MWSQRKSSGVLSFGLNSVVKGWHVRKAPDLHRALLSKSLTHDFGPTVETAHQTSMTGEQHGSLLVQERIVICEESYVLILMFGCQ